jgi:hypothetical protein
MNPAQVLPGEVALISRDPGGLATYAVSLPRRVPRRSPMSPPSWTPGAPASSRRRYPRARRVRRSTSGSRPWRAWPPARGRAPSTPRSPSRTPTSPISIGAGLPLPGAIRVVPTGPLRDRARTPPRRPRTRSTSPTRNAPGTRVPASRRRLRPPPATRAPATDPALPARRAGRSTRWFSPSRRDPGSPHQTFARSGEPTAHPLDEPDERRAGNTRLRPAPIPPRKRPAPSQLTRPSPPSRPRRRAGPSPLTRLSPLTQLAQATGPTRHRPVLDDRPGGSAFQARCG